MRRCEALLACALTLSCASTPVSVADAGCASCAVWGRPEPQGTLPLELSELSGLVAAARSPGVLFGHNDSGDTARFFAIDERGALLATFVLPDAGATDWEAVGRGPCEEGSCLFFGDLGDNAKVRGRYTIFRVPEPSIPGSASMPLAVQFTQLDVTYPDAGRRNAEAMLVHPVSGDLYVITKEPSGIPSEVFVLRQSGSLRAGAFELSGITTLPFPGPGDDPITAADVDPCGRRVLLRLYDGLIELSLADGQPFDSVFSSAPRRLPVAQEPQGEAVAFSHDGVSFFTGSERLNPTEPLNRSRCRP